VRFRTAGVNGAPSDILRLIDFVLKLRLGGPGRCGIPMERRHARLPFGRQGLREKG
jgi:hypothetical protein